MHSTHSVGQAASGGSENLQAAPPPLQQAQHPSQYPNGGNLAISAPAAAQSPSSPESQGFFWKDNVGFASSFLDEVERRAQRAQAELFKLGAAISTEEWWHARVAQPAIVEDWFHEDVGVFVAPGGTGKTTLLLFQVIHIVLGRDLFGHRVLNPGPVIILTAEDSRETLVARLRLMCQQLRLSQDEER